MNYPIHTSRNQLPAPTQGTQAYCQSAAPGVAHQVLEYTQAAMGVLQVVAGVVGCVAHGARQMAAQAPAQGPVREPQVHSTAALDEMIRTNAVPPVGPPPPPPVYTQPVAPTPPAPPVYTQAEPEPTVFHTASGVRII